MGSAGSEDTNAVMGDEISGVTCAETQIGGATTSCYATDMRAIRFQNGDPATQSSVKIATINSVNRKVTHATDSNPLVDYGDISVGDRVMLAVGSGLYETRTIDSIATDYKSFTVSKAFSAR